ncbi:MAG: hypothetical protein WC786_06410, partial [Patescibacteria group bacterium]
SRHIVLLWRFDLDTWSFVKSPHHHWCGAFLQTKSRGMKASTTQLILHSDFSRVRKGMSNRTSAKGGSGFAGKVRLKVLD